MKSRLVWTVLTVALLVALSSAVAVADADGCGKCNNCIKEIRIWGGLSSKPSTTDNYQPSEALIGIGRYDMLKITNPAVGFSVAEREVIVYNRLVEILSNGPVNSEAVRVCKVRSAPTVYVGPYRLVSVYPQDAAAAGLTCYELAKKWACQVAVALPLVAPTNAATKSGILHPNGGN